MKLAAPDYAVAPAPTTGVRQMYVTAFAGRRDSYQVPLALHENGRLGKFVTDAYDAGALAGMIRRGGVGRLAARRCPGLPAASVRPGFGLEVGERLLARLLEPSRGAVIADDWLARRGAAMANQLGASVLFYEFQAELGFRLLRSRRQRRILFHFHPHPGWEHPVLFQDARAYPEFLADLRSSTRTGLPPHFAEHTHRAWRAADHVVVASSCTRDSLLHVGCPAGRISLVPYGRETVEAAAPLATPPQEERPFLLWVGAGSFRKGLHHLCRAWELSGGARSAQLVVVARVVDPAMVQRLAAAGIKWIRGLPRAELNWYYQHARAFVLPSQSEGFGQVYLEALAHGCRIIGTRHSVLPDLAAAQAWIDYVEPGRIEALAGALTDALRRPAATAAERAAIAASVAGYTWEGFRAGLEAVLQRFD